MNTIIWFWLVVSFSPLPAASYYGIHGQKIPSLQKSISIPQKCENIVFNKDMIYIISWEKDGKKFTYELSEHDVITLIRAVNKEGKPQSAVTWSLLNRFAWLYPQYKSLASFVKAYSQPINPRWFPNGDLFLSSLEKVKNRKAALSRANARVEYSKLHLDNISDYVKDTVYGVLQGKISNPVYGAQHFIYSMAKTTDLEYEAQELQQDYLKQKPFLATIIPVDSARKGFNWFFSVKDDSRIFQVKIHKPLNSTNAGIGFIGLGFIMKWLGNKYA